MVDCCIGLLVLQSQLITESSLMTHQAELARRITLRVSTPARRLARNPLHDLRLQKQRAAIDNVEARPLRGVLADQCPKVWQAQKPEAAPVPLCMAERWRAPIDTTRVRVCLWAMDSADKQAAKQQASSVEGPKLPEPGPLLLSG